MKTMNMNNFIMHPWYLTGLTDAEGCFTVAIFKDDSRSIGYNIVVAFEIGLNKIDLHVMQSARDTMGIGEVYYSPSDTTYRWKVRSTTELSNVLIPHFNKYPLVTQKRADFELFSRIINIIISGKHLTTEGFNEIIGLRGSLNKGLGEGLQEAFPNVPIAPRPKVVNVNIPDPNWLTAFTDSEGCFYISIYDSPASRQGEAVQLVFKITQHSRDMELLKCMVDFFSCGRVENRKGGKACDLTVSSFRSFNSSIIPFFITHPLQGAKLFNFHQFKKAMDIINRREHLTEKGLEEIKNIKDTMNN